MIPSTTTRTINTAGNTDPTLTNPWKKPKRLANTAAATKATRIPIPKNELGTVTSVYGIDQKGMPAMKKHNRNAPIFTFFGVHRWFVAMAGCLVNNVGVRHEPV